MPTRESTPVVLPDEVAPTDRLEVSIEVDRATSLTTRHKLDDPSIFVEVMSYASFDGGITWVEAGGFGFYGGIHVRRTGEEATVSSGKTLFPRGAKGRLLKTITTTSRANVSIDPVVTTKIIEDPFVRAFDPNYRDLQPNRKFIVPVPINDRGEKS